jgi:protein-L-isoaspartate(D-aspartate) O-methyltransferase
MERNFSNSRKKMVNHQLISRGISDDLVLNAMGEVPREAFVPRKLRNLAYNDSALPIDEEQTISQPYMVALMIEALDLVPDSRVLEIGTGSGYATAVLSRVASQVFTVERHASLARVAEERFQKLGYENIRVHIGDGTMGWSEHAPYDGIVVTAGAPRIPDPLIKQLKVKANLVIPIADQQNSQKLIRLIRKDENEYQEENLGSVRFVPLIGEAGWDES